MYRPPYSTKQRFTENQFVEECRSLLAESMPHHEYIILMGELNVAWNDCDSQLIDAFNESLESHDNETSC